MAEAKITLIGMMDWFSAENDDLFKNLHLPAGVDKQTVIASIVMRGAEFPVLWANPYFVQTMIGQWSNKMQPTFDRWQKTLTEEYDPLHNYDRYEEYQDNEATAGTSSGTNTRKVTGYDSDTLRTNDQTGDESTASSDRQLDHKAHLYGNIGVTTSMTMLTEEIEGRAKFNIYSLIAEEFVNEFCVMVY